MSDPIDRELLRAFDLDRAGKSFEESLFDLDHAEMWVRLGVADSEVSETIFKYCESEFSKQTELILCPLRLGLSLHYIRSLGARHLLSGLIEALIKSGEDKRSDWFGIMNPLFEERDIETNSRAILTARESKRDGVSSFQTLAPLFAATTLGITALDTVALLATREHPSREASIQYVSERLQRGDLEATDHQYVQSWLWDYADLNRDLDSLLPVTVHLLSEKPSRSDILAIRLALLSPESAAAVCESLRGLNGELKSRFLSSLEKQLKRVGKISLWVRCREAIKTI